MEHILYQTQNELKKTKGFLNMTFPLSPREFLLSLFRGSFTTKIQKYASLKEKILLNYSSLYSDIRKDIADTDVDPSHIRNIEHSLLHITKTLKNCWNILEKIPAYNSKQQEIIHEEKVFFTKLMIFFNDDVHFWMETHRKEILWEISEVTTLQKNLSQKKWSAVLDLQKKRLEVLASNIEKLQK